MKNKFRILLAVILGVLAAASAALFFIVRSEYNGSLRQKKVEFSLAKSSYTAALENQAFADSVLLPTDLDGVYYNPSLSGEISYFNLTDNGFEAYNREVKTLEVSVTRAYQRLNAKIYYIADGSEFFGCGLYTAGQSSSSPVYPYAFFKLVNMPSGYGSSKLLLIDFDKNNLYKSDKIYSELYSLSMKTKKATLLVGENTRLVDLNGAPQSGWSMLTDGFIEAMGRADYYLSSREYGLDSRGRRSDVLRIGTGNTPEYAVRDILGLWVRNEADGLHFLRESEDGSGFEHIILSSGKEKTADSFEGDYFEDYLLSGDLLLNKNEATITNLLTGRVLEAGAEDILAADAFAVSEDGTKGVFVFYAENNAADTPVQKLIYSDFSAKTRDIFCEPLLFNEAVGVRFIDNDRVLHSRALNEDGGKTAMCCYSFEYAAKQKEKLSAQATAES